MENTTETFVARMEECYRTAYNVIVGLLEEEILISLDEEDIEHLEAAKKILGIISDIYADICTTTKVSKNEKRT